MVYKNSKIVIKTIYFRITIHSVVKVAMITGIL